MENRSRRPSSRDGLVLPQRPCVTTLIGFSAGAKEAELRQALLALLRHVDARDPGAELTERALAGDLGVEAGVIRRMVDWARDQALIRVGAGDSARGRSMALTSTGVECLDALAVPEAAVTTGRSAWTLDVSFVHDGSIRRVLERNVQELDGAQRQGLHTAAIVLAGAIGEGVLYDALVHRKSRALGAASAPKDKKTGVVKDIESDRWSFYNHIEVAGEIGVLAQTTMQMIHQVLREFRNMIHPKVQVDQNLTPDDAEMKASVAWLEAVARDVRKAP